MRILLALCVLFSLIRLYPIIENGDAAFGYDTGIYRRIAREYSGSLEKKPPFAFGTLAHGLHAVGLSDDAILVGLYVGVSTLLVIALYFFTRETVGKRGASIAVFLFSTSLVQYEFYWWYYYRQMITAALIMWLWYCFSRRQWVWMTLLCVGIGSIHPLSLIPVVITLGVLFIIHKKDRVRLAQVVCVSLLAVILFNWQEFTPYLRIFSNQHGLASNTAGSEELSGQFIPLTSYIGLSIMYLAFGLIGLKKYFRNHLSISIMTLASLFLFIIHITFYRRFLVFVDLGMIFFAVVFLDQFLDTIKNIRTARVLVAAYVILLSVYLGWYMREKTPLVSQTDIQLIASLQQLPSDSLVMTVSSASAPWVYGFTTQRIIAPGMFEDNLWNEADWKIFWETKNNAIRDALLERYHQPVYIVTGMQDRWLESSWHEDKKIIHLREGLWKFQ